MNNIDKAIERLDEITSVRCGGEFTHFHTVDLNECRSEIKALLTADVALMRYEIDGEVDGWLRWDEHYAAMYDALTTLIFKIMET